MLDMLSPLIGIFAKRGIILLVFENVSYFSLQGKRSSIKDTLYKFIEFLVKFTLL